MLLVNRPLFTVEVRIFEKKKTQCRFSRRRACRKTINIACGFKIYGSLLSFVFTRNRKRYKTEPIYFVTSLEKNACGKNRAMVKAMVTKNGKA